MDVQAVTKPRFLLSADADSEVDIVPGLHGAAGDGRPLEETHCESMLTAADFRV